VLQRLLAMGWNVARQMGEDKVKGALKAELEEAQGKLRLFVDVALSQGAPVSIEAAQAHYLLHVMRARTGDRVRLFNGREGEWRAVITQAGRRALELACEIQTEPQVEVPDLWLIFAPIKKTPADYVAQKATELGVRVLQPVLTRRTIVRRVNVDRLRANAIEAAEQSGRLSVPEIRPPRDLELLLRDWPQERRMLFCDESGGAPIADALNEARIERIPWAVLTGPEGGFAPEERVLIRKSPQVVPVSLGPRIVRADTGALAALAIWQAICGDWR
jgi:16S rRNA (uracil1498-N3)-methyltransferase